MNISGESITNSGPNVVYRTGDVMSGTLTVPDLIAINSITGPFVGSNTITGTTITATTQFSGPGTGLSGTATSLSVGGTSGGLTGTPNITVGTVFSSGTPAASANVLTVIGSSTTGNVVQFSNTVAGGTFIMTASSNVGIGTLIPSAKFHVAGTSASNQVAKLVGIGAACYVTLDNDNTANQTALQFNRNGVVQWINYVPGSSTDMRWYNGSVDRMTLTNAGALTCSNDITAFSDIRHKTNLKRIQYALDKVSALNGYTFNRTDDEDKDKRYVGVVAQEVLEVLPEVVHTNKDGFHSVAYGNLTALLIEALKEEREKREALEARIAKLESISL